MHRISIEGYVFQGVFWPDGFFTTGFFVAGDVLFQCNFSFCFLLQYFSLCCDLFFTSWFFAFVFCWFAVQFFQGQFLVLCHFFDDCFIFLDFLYQF